MELLFPELIPRVQDLTVLGPVLTEHTNEAIYVADPSGAVWVSKSASQIGWNGLLAEAASWLIGRHLGAPLPDAAVCLDGAHPQWLSRCIPNISAHWGEKHVSQISNIAALGPTIVMDVLVGNPDRHARNLLLQATETTQLHLWAIDQDQAVIGQLEDFCVDPMLVPATRNLARGLPVDLFEIAAMEAASRAKAMEASQIVGFVKEACTIAGESAAKALADVLIVRAANADSLLRSYLQRVRERR